MPYAYKTPIIVGSAPEVTRWKAMEAPSLANALAAEYQAREQQAAQERNYWNQERARADQAEQIRYNRAAEARANAENASRWQAGNQWERDKFARQVQFSEADRVASEAANKAKVGDTAAHDNYTNIFNQIGSLYKSQSDIPVEQFKLLTPDQKQNIATAFTRQLEAAKATSDRKELLNDAISLLGPTPTQQQIKAVESQINSGFLTPEKVKKMRMDSLRKQQASVPDLPIPNPYWEASKYIAPISMRFPAALAEYAESKAKKYFEPEAQMENPIPLPKDQSKWIVGKPYIGPKGIGIWTGTGFIQE